MELAGVFRTICVSRDPIARDLTLDPVAFITAAVSKCDLALAMRSACFECTFIDRAIRETRHTHAANLSHHPVAGIFVSIGLSVGALAVLYTVFETAFVDAAIVILFCGGLLREGWQTECNDCSEQQSGGSSHLCLLEASFEGNIVLSDRG